MTRLITGTGSYLPQKEVSNDELLRYVKNFDAERAGASLDEWIRSHYGVATRHWAREDESTGDMATAAARRALDDAGLKPKDIDLIVMATATSDHLAPHSVSAVQAALECDAVFHQIQAACPGFLEALMVADSLMANIGYRRALVLAGDKMTHICDKRDFRMIGLFADAAGGVVLEDVPLEGDFGMQGFYAGSCGSKGYVLRVPAGGSRRPISAERLAAGEHFLISEFKEVYAFAVETTARCVHEACKRAGISVDDVDWLIPHHASRNIIVDSLQTCGVPEKKVVMAIEHTGNTSSGSVPTALDEAARAGRFRPGDNLVLLALGAGLGWGSTVYRWCDPAVARAARR